MTRQRFDGRKAVVTAAAQGIGQAVARALADSGAAVIATDINKDTLKAFCTERPDIRCEVLDVTDRSAVADFAARTGAINVLVNCAGVVHAGTVLDCTEAEWAFAFDLNAGRDAMLAL